MFSYENKTKTNSENKENEFTIFNILYINQKTVLCCFPCFRIIRIQKNVKQNQIISEKKCKEITKIKTKIKWQKMNSNLHFKHIFIVFINFIFKKIVLQNGFSYSLFSTKFKYETYFLKMKTKD